MQNQKEKQEKHRIVKMYEKYPFGLLTEAIGEDEQVLVQKKLVCYSEKQQLIITKMAEFLQKIKHQFLINFHHVDQGVDDDYYFYYEYAPLTLDKWILDLGDEILDELKEQMINLVHYLVTNGITFSFDPECLGLSKQIKVKYFLDKFSIDYQGKIDNYKRIETEILQFFKNFKQKYEKESSLQERKSADSANLLASITTRQSWDVKSAKSVRVSMPKIQTLNQKVQNAKKKHLQILERLKGLKKIPGKLQ